MNFITTVKDAVAKCFEQLYDQQGIFSNELAIHASAYSKIDLLLHSWIYFYFYKMHLLRTQKTRVILKPSKNIGGVPYAPSQRKQEQDQDRKSNR